MKFYFVLKSKDFFSKCTQKRKLHSLLKEQARCGLGIGFCLFTELSYTMGGEGTIMKKCPGGE